jgi:hypothetical protein
MEFPQEDFLTIRVYGKRVLQLRVSTKRSSLQIKVHRKWVFIIIRDF